MNYHHLVLTIALALISPVPVLHAQSTDSGNAMSDTTAILASLRQEHPRLIALDKDIRAASNLLKTQTGQAWLKNLREAGERVIAEPPVKHELVGPRLLFQSRAALNRITLLAFLHRLQPDQRYVDRAVLEMETACAFPDWNPSHFLDTAEMTTAMAIGYDWLYKDLTPQTRKKVRDGIVKLGLQPGMKVYRRNVWWVKGRNNWNHVCNSGLMIGALAIADEEPEIAARILKNGKRSLAKGMALFAPDGGWFEGPGYWAYTTKYTTLGLSALHTSLGTAFGLDQVPGFENTGNFMLAMESPTGKYFNWGDGGEQVGNLPELFWLAGHFDQPVIAWLAQEHTSGNPDVFDLLWHSPDQKAPGQETSPDWYFGGIEVGSMRQGWQNPAASFVAYKGGDNAAPHSNLDLGTFVFDSDGKRWAMDLGSDDYNLPGYWNKTQRLAYYRIRTEGQNTLVLNGEEQVLDATSKIIRKGGTGTTAFAIADLANAYPMTTKAQRGFMLTGTPGNGARRHLVIQDELESTGPLDIRWYMHTQAKVEVQGNSALMRLDDSTATLHVLEPAGAKLIVESAEQPPPQKSNKGISRIAVSHTAQSGPVRVVVQISPGSATPILYKTQPLDHWR